MLPADLTKKNVLRQLKILCINLLRSSTQAKLRDVMAAAAKPEQEEFSTIMCDAVSASSLRLNESKPRRPEEAAIHGLLLLLCALQKTTNVSQAKWYAQAANAFYLAGNKFLSIYCTHCFIAHASDAEKNQAYDRYQMLVESITERERLDIDLSYLHEVLEVISRSNYHNGHRFSRLVVAFDQFAPYPRFFSGSSRGPVEEPPKVGVLS